MLRADTRMSVPHDPPHRKRWSRDTPPMMRIVLLGSSESENSQVGNFILGRAAFDSEAPPDVVERVAGRLKHRHMIVINSPQLLQKNISDNQITQTVRECVNLSDPGPHVIVLLLRHDQCSAEDQECVEKVLHSFSEQVYQHTMVITTQEPTETNDILQKIIQKCANRHFRLQRSITSPDDLLQALEHIEQINDGRHLVCEGSQNISVNQQATGRFSEGVKLNLVVCGSDETLKNSISELIQQQTDVELHGRLINVVKLPALIRLSEEQVTLQTLRCVSLCHPGVHVFLLIVPIGPLTDGDKAEMEKIQRTFSSTINKHILILINQSSEHQTAELSEETQAVITSFGGRHHVFDPKTQVSTLMKSIEQLLKENNEGFFFSTETIWEAQMRKFEEILKRFHSLQINTQSQGLTKNRDALRIVLLGKTGVGKSASGNTILGRDVFKAETSHKAITKEIKRETSEMNGRHITVIDTPGLFDTELSNEEIKREIRHCISMILPGPHVFIIVLNLGQRFTQEEVASVKIIQEMFGENSLMYTMVLFTRGDDLKNKTIEQFLGKPGSPLMNLIEACGNRCHVFNNNQTEDRTQVFELLEKIGNMVKANRGSFYSCKMFREMETEKQEQHVKILIEKVREKEEETKKLEEENERMKMIMMEEKRKNHEKNTKRRNKQDDKRSEKEKQTCSDTYDTLQVTVYRKLETEHSKWSWSLRKAMMEIENELHNKIENDEINDVKETDLHKELEGKKEEVGKLMSDFFEKDTDAVILIQWKTSFENKIKELQENIVRETKRKLNEIIQQRDIKKNVYAQKKHHDNTLYEKSKELALNHKDKTNEKTLKKEFDLFWEQMIKNIQSDQKNPIEDIDIMRDVKKLNINVYKIVSVSHWRESKDIFIVSSYSDYVKLKKFSGITKSVKNAIRNSKEMFGYAITEKDEAQIRSLITDIVQQTDTMMQSFNISKMGYNISCFQQLTGYIKAKITEHQEGPVKYKFKKTFFMDLVYSICKRANRMVTDQHRLFREANDPAIYVEKKREEYYSIFQKCCHGSASAVIFGEIICQKLKEPIEQSVYKKTARDLTDEMRSNCESLNGNRANLEKHILKKLAEEEDFEKYMNYIHNPRDHFKSFIRDEVNQYIIHKFSVSVLPKMKENIKLLQQKITEAAHQSTEHVQENRDVFLWLKSFTQQLSDELIFSEEDLSGVKHDDVNDFKLLEDVIRKEFPAIMSEIGQRFNRNTFSVNLDYKDRPHQFLIDHFCQCCWVQCPFCKATCTNTIENHDEDHSVSFHRVDGINGTYHSGTQNLSADICTNLVGTDQDFNTPEGQFKYKEYSTAGGVYADWSIMPETSELPYWKWFVCRFQKDLEKCYRKTFERKGKIPDKWKKYKKQDAIESLDQYI